MPATRRVSDRQAATRAEPYPAIRPGDKPKALAEKSSAPLNKTVAAPKNTTAKKTAIKDEPVKKVPAKKEAAKKEVAKKVPEKKVAPKKEVTKKVSTDKVTKAKPAKGKAVVVKEQQVKEEEEELIEPAVAPPKETSKKASKAKATKGVGKKVTPVVEEQSFADAIDSAATLPKEKKVSKAKATKEPASKAEEIPADVVMDSAQVVPEKAAGKPAKGKAAEEKPTSYLHVELEGDDSDLEIPIYDTCSEIRRKITSLLLKDSNKPENGVPGEFKKDGTPKPYTKALFCKFLGVSTSMLDTFMKAKKLMGGAESEVYVEAYKFFERKRIWEGKKKTAGRLKVEDE